MTLQDIALALLPTVFAVAGCKVGMRRGRDEGRAEALAWSHSYTDSLHNLIRQLHRALNHVAERNQVLLALLRATGANVVLPKDGAETRH